MPHGQGGLSRPRGREGLAARRAHPAVRGFKTYELEYGENESPGAFFLDPPGGGNTFSNAQEPPPVAPRLTLGGGIQFPDGRKRIRLAFPITYASQGDDPNIVRVVGTATCRFARGR